jgi:hypothetical protein
MHSTMSIQAAATTTTVLEEHSPNARFEFSGLELLLSLKKNDQDDQDLDQDLDDFLFQDANDSVQYCSDLETCLFVDEFKSSTCTQHSVPLNDGAHSHQEPKGDSTGTAPSSDKNKNKKKGFQHRRRLSSDCIIRSME